MNRLGWKFLLLMLLVSLGGLALAAFLITNNLNNNFRHYLYQQAIKKDQELVELIESLYAEKEDWPALIPDLLKMDIVSRVWLKIYDEKGVLIYDTRLTSMNSVRRRMMNRLSKIPVGGAYRKYDLTVNNNLIGYLHVKSLQEPGAYSQQDKFFVFEFRQGLYRAAGIIALMTIILSYYFSRRLTKPLLEISQASKKIAQGDFAKRVEVKGKDEIADLARGFNEMARKLEHLEKIRRESSTNLAHELRTPLTTMQSYLEALEDGLIPLNQENIAELHAELKRLIRLVNRLGDLTDLEGRLLNLKKEKINLKNIIQGMVHRYKPLILEKGLELQVKYSEQSVYTFGDSDSLEEVLANLLSNAIKYTEAPGQIQLKVFPEGERVWIIVEDTGQGIAPADLPYIFERFYQADKSRSSSTGGAGIGLTIVKEIIEAHQGEIQVDSIPGQGSSFKLILPRAQN